MTHDYLSTFDVRTATRDSDSTPIYPHDSESDADHPGYWPEHRANTPPPSNSPPPATISDTQLADWVQSQLPWHEFRQRIPALQNAPDELCGPPNIPRLYPPHQYMLDHQHGTPDQLGVNDRTHRFYRDPHPNTWTQYITTLRPLVRRYYNTLPPFCHNYPPNTSTPTTPRATRPGGYSSHTNTTANKSQHRKRQRTTPPTSGSDPEGYSGPNQAYDRPNQPERIRIGHPSSIADAKRSSEEATYGSSSQGPRPRLAHEDKSTPHLTPNLISRAANRRAAHVRNWYRENHGPLNNLNTTETTSDMTTTSSKDPTNRKDPAQPHPEDLPTPPDY